MLTSRDILQEEVEATGRRFPPAHQLGRAALDRLVFDDGFSGVLFDGRDAFKCVFLARITLGHGDGLAVADNELEAKFPGFIFVDFKFGSHIVSPLYD